MSNPRDFLPAKYKKKQTNDRVIVATPTVDNSPWSDLAKEPSLPAFRSRYLDLADSQSAQMTDVVASNSSMAKLDSDTVGATSSVSAPSFSVKPKKRRGVNVIGALAVLFLVVGVFASYLLSRQSQDNRQQASVGNEPYITQPPGSVNGTNGSFGDCIGAGCTNNLIDNWNNPDLLIRGTYVGHDKDGKPIRILVGGSGAQSTANAAIKFAYGLINSAPGVTYSNASDFISLSHPDTLKPLNIIPFVPSSECDGTSGKCAAEGFSTTTPDGQTLFFTYITQSYYEQLVSEGKTWVPAGVGCGDTAGDTIDCNSFHFTTCEAAGSGTDLLGCGEATNNGGGGDTPTDTPPVTITTTTSLMACGDFNCVSDSFCGTGLVCQTIPANGSVAARKVCAKPANNLACATDPTTANCCNTQIQPTCSNIEILNASGSVMTADDDRNLRNNDQVRFRATASNASSADLTYQFRIMAPNASTWRDLTNTVEGAVALNISAPYTIISSGHHIVQARICIAGTCQDWENVDTSSINPSSSSGETPSNPTSLIAQWNFNETSGTIAGSSGSCGAICSGTLNNFALTTSQDASPSSGWTNNKKLFGAGAIKLDGINDYVQTANFDTTGKTAISVETWIRTNATAREMSLQFKGLMLYINRFTSGKVFIGFDDTSTNNSAADESKTTVTDGAWHYIVGTNNGTTTRIYVDGVLETTYADPLVTGVKPIVIGSNAGTKNFFRGVIDSTRIYARVLSDSEILANYNSRN